jgi:hypothetical protein
VPRHDWLEVWTDYGYQAVLGPDKGWSVRSALLLRDDVRILGPLSWSNTDYHGSYVAGCVVSTGLGPLSLVSVHASPNEAELEKYECQGRRPRLGTAVMTRGM